MSNNKFSLFFLISFFCGVIFSASVSLSQMKLQSTSQNNNIFAFKISFNEQFTLTDSGNNKVMKFVNSVDVSKPGSPSLPSKIVYVAIPPKSKANISLISQQYQIYSGIS